MSQDTNLAKKAVPISRQVLLDRARGLIPALKSRARQTEIDRRVSAETIAMFRDADLFRVLQPKRFGGFEYDFGLLLEIIVELGRGCASSAWVYGLGAVHQWLIANFPIDAQEEVWGDDPNDIVTGSYAPSAHAKVEAGGFRVSGTWSFVSGVDNAKWSLVGVFIPPELAEDRPQAGFLLVPATDYVIEDNWNTYGLCGTGSKNIVLDDVFVPAHRKLTFKEASSGKSPGSAVHGNPLYRIPFLAAVPVSIAAPALGAAQGAIDDFLDTIRVRTTRGAVAGAGARMAEFGSVQSRVAEAMACVDAAKLLLLRDCEEVLSGVSAGNGISIDTRIRNRRDHAFSVRLAVQAVDALNSCTGGGGLFTNNVAQRAWRDANAAAKHISLNWDAVSTMVGQQAFGLEPKGQY